MEQGSIFKFAFIADSQIGMNSRWGLDGPGSDRNRLLSAIRFVNANNIDFVIFGGDQINNAEGDNTDAQLDTFIECLSELTVPHYGVAGNHDQGEPAKNWKYFERDLPNRFSFVHQDVAFAGINASWLRGAFGDEYQQKEIEHLEQAMAQIPEACKLRFLTMHWPLFSGHPSEDDTYWNMPNRHAVIDLLKKHEISCVLSGHWQQDIDASWHGINLITSVGTSLPLQYPEELAFKVFTVFSDGWSARRVSVEAV